jgi:hypothetical protein
LNKFFPLLSATLALSILAAGSALAQDQVPPPVKLPPMLPAPDSAPGPDLYLDAMQAISENRNGDAGEILARMQAQGPRQAGEWLDLALIQCALGRQAEAEALFREIEQRFAPPPGINDIIAEQRKQGCHAIAAKSQWSLTLARGTDSNVNQGASNPMFAIGGGEPLELLPDYLPKADRYSLVSGDYQRDLTQNGDTGFAQFYLRQNDHVSDFNTASIFFGVEHPWRLGHWRLRSAALGGAMSLGGRLYQEQGQLQLRATPPLPLPDALDFDILTNVSHTDYKTLSDFDASTLDVRGVLGYHGDSMQGQFSLGYLADRGDSARPGGNRNGWTTRLFGHTGLGEKFQAELDLSRQVWHGQSAYSPGLIDDKRNQATNSLRATLIYPLSRDQALHLEWRQIRNQENISIFQYDSRQLQLSWHWYGM